MTRNNLKNYLIKSGETERRKVAKIMLFCRNNRNALDDTIWEFGKTGWWVAHIVSAGLVAFAGYMCCMICKNKK